MNLNLQGAMKTHAWKDHGQRRQMAATSSAVAANKRSDAMLLFDGTYRKDGAVDDQLLAGGRHTRLSVGGDAQS
jgi:hypothetical protein